MTNLSFPFSCSLQKVTNSSQENISNLSSLATFMATFYQINLICDDCFVISLSLNCLTKTCLQPWAHSAKLLEII